MACLFVACTEGAFVETYLCHTNLKESPHAVTSYYLGQ